MVGIVVLVLCLVPFLRMSRTGSFEQADLFVELFVELLLSCCLTLVRFSFVFEQALIRNC